MELFCIIFVFFMQNHTCRDYAGSFEQELEIYEILYFSLVLVFFLNKRYIFIWRLLIKELKSVVLFIRMVYPNCPITVLSSLAEGVDRLCARAALKAGSRFFRLNHHLILTVCTLHNHML